MTLWWRSVIYCFSFFLLLLLLHGFIFSELNDQHAKLLACARDCLCARVWVSRLLLSSLVSHYHPEQRHQFHILFLSSSSLFSVPLHFFSSTSPLAIHSHSTFFFGHIFSTFSLVVSSTSFLSCSSFVVFWCQTMKLFGAKLCHSLCRWPCSRFFSTPQLK